MSPGSAVHHLRGLSECGGQGENVIPYSLYPSIKVKSHWKNKEKEERNERAQPGAKTSRSNSTYNQPLS